MFFKLFMFVPQCERPGFTQIPFYSYGIPLGIPIVILLPKTYVQVNVLYNIKL